MENISVHGYGVAADPQEMCGVSYQGRSDNVCIGTSAIDLLVQVCVCVFLAVTPLLNQVSFIFGADERWMHFINLDASHNNTRTHTRMHTRRAEKDAGHIGGGSI